MFSWPGTDKVTPSKNPPRSTWGDAITLVIINEPGSRLPYVQASPSR